MNALTRWKPFKEMEEMQSRILNLFDSWNRAPREGEEMLADSDWMPLVDITEDAEAYLLEAELPEIRKEDVHVTVQSGRLIIMGERKHHEEDKTRTYHRVERSYGRFARSFALPTDADLNQVRAEFKDGVLKVHVRKSPEAQPKQIDVEGA
jgi:HSP20 family protein